MLYFKKILAVGVFVLAMFLMIEITYRCYTVGPAAGLNPVLANSMNTLMRSEFVQLSEFPDLFFELKPDLNGWFRGVRFATNSAGLADKEYSRAKPEDVFRVAVAGSSWTMGSGVEPDEAWPAVLERQLNGQKSDPTIEVLNFGVEMYGLRELVATVRHKVKEWNPDLIVVPITSFTTHFLWEETNKNPTLPERAYPFFDSFALRAFINLLGWSIDKPADDRVRLDPAMPNLRLAQLERTLNELAELQIKNDVPIVVIYLGYFPLTPEIEQAQLQQASQLGIKVIYANQIFPIESKERHKLQISRYDRHPNGSGHELIASSIGEGLMLQGLLP